MKILVFESPCNSLEEMDELYNSFTDAEVDVECASEIDFEEEIDDYDAVISELVLED
jgi:hypothetical protein